MRKLIIASNNAHKVTEIKAIIGNDFEAVLSMKEAGIELDIVEDGNTFEDNAYIKARAIIELLPDCAVISDDSGLEVDALGGAPGVHSARYAGDQHDDAANNAKLLEAMQSVPDEKRTGRFVSVIALCRPDREPMIVRGECEGLIARKESGKNGFGYDPLFVVPSLNRTFGELTDEEKNSLSHRALALAALRKALDNEKNE